MELQLAAEPGGKIAVYCDDLSSHCFDLTILFPTQGVEVRPLQPSDASREFGAAMFQALFPDGSPARQALDTKPRRILLVTTDETLQAIPWEYACGPGGFLVLDFLPLRARPGARTAHRPAHPGRRPAYRHRPFQPAQQAARTS